MMDQIKIFYKADEEVNAALVKHKDYIMKENTSCRAERKSSPSWWSMTSMDIKTGIDVERI